MAQTLVWVRYHNKTIKLIAIPLLLAMMVGIYFFVYSTGGIKYAFSHSMYIAIILAALIFGVRGGLIAGGIGGIILGPLMPIDVITHEPQEPLNWIYRTCIFILIGIVIGAASDSTQKHLKRVTWIMSHDLNSELPNRMALIDAIKNTALAQAEVENGLAIISIDNVEEMDSAYGPEVIDGIIRELADRFSRVLDDNIIIYRTNTHQLGILLPATEKDGNGVLLDKLAEVSKRPFGLKDIAIHGDVRIGYTHLPILEDAPENYLRKAEIAMLTACEQSQRWVFFTPELDAETAKNNLQLLSELKDALECGQLTLCYQPKVFVATRKIQGVEALMRWQHPKLGLIPPGNFIPRAEQSVLIELMTEWAIDTALTQHVKWKNEGLEIPVAVNVSPKNLLQPGFVDTVRRLLDRHQVDGKFLELEMTESALMLDIERSTVKLMELSGLQVIISIDDFGTGYSSLRYLNSLPATIIKVDQSFIRSLSTNKGSKHIVEAAVSLAHGLKMTVVAEGVEDKLSYDFLSYVGCDIAQGYYISHALPGNEILDVWRSKEIVTV